MSFDIDGNENSFITTASTLKLLEALNFIIPLTEYSPSSSGYHFYVPCDRYIDNNKIDLFVKKLNKELYEYFISLGIEVKPTQRFIENPPYLRIINSPSYTVYNIKNKKELIDLIQNDIKSEVITEWSDMYHYATRLDTFCFELIDEQIKEEEVIIKNKVQGKSFITRTRTSKKSLHKLYDDITIGNGNRYYPMQLMTSYGGMGLGKTALELAQDALSKDTGSKDFKLWKYSVAKITSVFQKNIDAFSQSYQNYHDSKKQANDFQSNAHLLPEHIKANIDLLVNKVLDRSRYTTNKKRKQVFNTTKNIILEMIGQTIFDDNNQKIITDKRISTKSGKVGTSFSRRWVELFREHYNIPKHTVDIHHLISVIVSFKELFTQQSYNINNKEVEYLFINYKACKSYIGKSIECINEFLLHLNNKLKMILSTIKNKKKSIKKEIDESLLFFIKYYVKSNNSNIMTFDYGST